MLETFFRAFTNMTLPAFYKTVDFSIQTHFCDTKPKAKVSELNVTLSVFSTENTVNLTSLFALNAPPYPCDGFEFGLSTGPAFANLSVDGLYIENNTLVILTNDTQD